MSVAAQTQSEATAQRASGSSFYAAMKILPAAQREAMFEIYSFCRAVDDIADGNDPRPQRVTELAQWRRDIDALYADSPAPALASLARTVQAFGLRREDFLAVIDGMEMDAVADIRAPDYATLDLYCDRVASAVGRLSVRVFGLQDDAGRELAYHLGRALQLTNILRDVDEDAAIGRLYLPAEALSEAGIATTDPVAVLASPALTRACAYVGKRAQAHFIAADKIMAQAPRRAVRAPRIMGAVYHLILNGMLRRGFAPPRIRVRVPRARLALILLRYALI